MSRLNRALSGFFFGTNAVLCGTLLGLGDLRDGIICGMIALLCGWASVRKED